MGRYNELFPDDKSKADAFDKLAERFYERNFGTMSKTDIETLMFSIYIEQILAISDTDFSTYSDYTLANELGISQTKVSNLKVRKQLQYPRKYDWQTAFERISDRARYESGKILMQIPDINLYYDIKNAIEKDGGFVEVTLNRGLLVVPLCSFLDFMKIFAEGEDRENLCKTIKNKYMEYQKNQEFVEKEPTGQMLKRCGESVVVDLIGDVLTSMSPISAGLKVVANIGKNIYKAIR